MTANTMRKITANEMARIAENLARKGGGLLKIRYEQRENKADVLNIGYSDGIGFKGVCITEGQDYARAMNTAQEISQLVYRTLHLKEKMTDRDKRLVEVARSKAWEDIDIWAAESKEGRAELKNISSFKYHRDEYRS